MARSNKYSSLNFNDIFEKKLNNRVSPAVNSSVSSSGSAVANQGKHSVSRAKIHGHMLVLSRPAPKLFSSTAQVLDSKEKTSPVAAAPDRDQPRAGTETEDKGGIGSDTVLSPPPPVSPVKSDRFVPPHLRPGFVGKEENIGSEFAKGRQANFKVKSELGHKAGSGQGVSVQGSRPNRYGEDGRPKSGGGFTQIKRSGEPAYPNRSGPNNRPSSSG